MDFFPRIRRILPLGVKLVLMLALAALVAGLISDAMFSARMRRDFEARVARELGREGRRQEQQFLLFSRHLVDIAEKIEHKSGFVDSLGPQAGCDQEFDPAMRLMVSRLAAVYSSTPRGIKTLFRPPDALSLPVELLNSGLLAYVNRGPRPVAVGDNVFLVFQLPARDRDSLLIAMRIDRGFLKQAVSAGGNRHVALLRPDGVVLAATASGCRAGEIIDQERYRYQVIRRFRPSVLSAAMDFVTIRPISRWKEESETLLRRARYERFFTGLSIVIPALLLILLATVRLRRLAVEVGRFQETALGMDSSLRPRGDEIMGLEVMFADLALEVSRSHELIKKQAREENRVIVESAMDAIIALDHGGRVVSWNPAAALVFGWQFSEVRGRELGGLIFSGGARIAFARELAYFREHGHGITLDRISERLARHRDGHELPVEMFVTAVSLDSGPGFVAFFRDSTSIKSREKKLANARRQQTVINSLLRIYLDRIGLTEQLDLALDHIFSIPDLGLVRKGAVFLVEDEPDVLVLAVQRGFSDEQTESCRRIPVDNDLCGRISGIEISSFFSGESGGNGFEGGDDRGHYCVPIRAGGSLLGLLLLYVDSEYESSGSEEKILGVVARTLAGIIERKMIEDHLDLLIESLKYSVQESREEKLFSESVIASLDSGLAVIDTDGIVSLVNPAGRAIFSFFCHGDPVGKEIGEILGRDFSAIVEIQAGGQAEAGVVTLAGEERLLRLSRAVLDENSGRSGSILLFQDVTVEHNLRRDMEKMNRLATVAEIASAVAHEVRNPLAGIKTMGQVIEERMDRDDANREYVTRIVRQVDRLNQLLTEFFTYARPPEPKKQEVDLGAVLHDTMQLVMARMRRRGIAVDIDVSGDTMVWADPAQVQQVMLNLLLNGMQAIGSDGNIDIIATPIVREDLTRMNRLPPELDRGGDYVKVVVRDNGCGIPVELVDKVFEPFFTTRHDGTGLGLAIVYRILKENGAFVYVDSVVGESTQFNIFFEAVHGRQGAGG